MSTSPPPIDRATDRRNGDLFLWTNLLIYLAAPVFYVGVVQAALCDKLGASATLANLPSVSFFFGSFAPIVFACFVPYRWERGMLVLTGYLMAVLVALVALMLFLPLSNSVRIGAVVGQGLVLGVLNNVNQLYSMQCLGRGTTDWGRSRALKLTYTFGPIAAVAGSLAGQFILRGGFSFLKFPRDFALLYLIGVPCSAIGAWCSHRMVLAPMEEKPRPPFLATLGGSFRRYLRSPAMIRLWLGYVCWYSAFLILPTLSLFTKQALHREPAAFSGIITAVQFGSKAIAGYFLGNLYLRRGVRAPLIATVACLGLAVAWAWVVPGYAYLAAFGLVGAGQLGGVYFPNVLLSWSPSSLATQDLAVLSLATLVASPTPGVYGLLTDHWGFASSFGLGIAFAVVGLILVLRLPRQAPTQSETRA